MHTNNVDVLIIGAGISGIGAAIHLQRKSPQRTFAIVEARADLGGTWDLFKYPGIRSDSDMYTFGFKFKPWISSTAISSGKFIKRYLQEAASESGLDKKIEYSSRVVRVDWCSKAVRWSILIEDVSNGSRRTVSSRFIFSCGGYFNYENGYTPDFENVDTYEGQIIHPQQWPESANWKGKKVIVVGSGATAMTLDPALAKSAKHVTLLQRSPTYIVSRPAKDETAALIQRILPTRMAYSLIRWRNILGGIFLFWFTRTFPATSKKVMFKNVQKILQAEKKPSGPTMTTREFRKHFMPRYNPWDQRICLVPDGDLFKAIKSGSVSVVTDHIQKFTPDGIELKSGEHLAADFVVTATGLSIDVFSGIELYVDNQRIYPNQTYCYKGMMLSDIPNFAFSIGYTNASWTLKSDLVGEYVCRLLNHMDKHQYDRCTPRTPHDGLKERPLMDFTSGYVTRAQDQMPKQGSRPPWRLYQNYILDRLSLGFASVEDSSMVFQRTDRKQ